ncbi:hypothetical protein ACFX13_027413 [Malus domestica]
MIFQWALLSLVASSLLSLDYKVIAVEAVVEQAQYSLCFHSSPSRSDPNAITQSINSSLVNMNYCGPVSISAYVRQSGSQESGSL